MHKYYNSQLYCDPATYHAQIHMVKDKTNYTAPTFKRVSSMRYQEHTHHALIPDICPFWYTSSFLRYAKSTPPPGQISTMHAL